MNSCGDGILRALIEGREWRYCENSDSVVIAHLLNAAKNFNEE